MEGRPQNVVAPAREQVADVDDDRARNGRRREVFTRVRVLDLQAAYLILGEV